MFGLPKTADVVVTDLVGLSFNQIEICWLCNTSNSLAGKAFFSHEQQNKTTIFDFFDGYKGAGSFHIHRKTMKELGTLAVLDVREQPNLAHNFVARRH